MATIASINVLLGMDAASFQNTLQQAQSRLDSFAKSATEMGKSLSLKVTAPLTLLGATSLEAASDLEESLSKSTVVFGDNATAIQEWSETSSTAFGLSQQDALEAAASLGNLFTTMGQSQSAASGMSMDLVQLSADLASFNNIPVADALAALQSGLVGETEPMRRLGVVINESAVAAKAMEMGLANADGTISEAAKVQARYALILEQTTNAQGDFQRTSDGLANSQRTLQAEWENAQATIGEQLLPVVTELAKALSEALRWFTSLPEPVQKGVVIVAALAAAVGPLLIGIGMLIPALGALGAAVTLATGPVGLVVIAIAAVVAGLILAYNNIEIFRQAVDGVVAFVQEFIDILNEQGLGAALQFAGNAIRESLTAALEALKEFWDTTLWPWLQELPGTIQGLFADAVNWLTASGADIIGGLLTGLQDWWNNQAGPWLMTIPQWIIDLFKDAGTWLFNAGAAVVQGLIDGIGSKFSDLGSKVSELQDAVTFWDNGEQQPAAPAEAAPAGGGGAVGGRASMVAPGGGRGVQQTNNFYVSGTDPVVVKNLVMADLAMATERAMAGR